MMNDGCLDDTRSEDVTEKYIDTDESLLSLFIFHDDSLVREG